MPGMTYSARGSRLAKLLLLTLILSLILVGGASSEGAPYREVPNYPRYGCLDVLTAGMGMYTNGTTLFPLVARVPGPVVDAYMVWLGTEDVGAPDSPNQSDLSVNGTTVLGQLIDRKKYSANANVSEWFMWRADIGPNGYNLVQEGYNSYNITGWMPTASDIRRNGVSIVIVYDTGVCTRPNQIDLIDNMDWYWERTLNEETTAPMVFEFPPAPKEREVTVWLNHAGTDSKNPCRPERVWSASGTGTPPDNLVAYGSPSTGVNGGTIIVDPGFGPFTTCGTVTHPPVTLIDGTYIDAEWSITKLKILVPAGNTWLALQGESVKTNAQEVEQTGESGAWFGQASIPLYNPELSVVKTDGVDQATPGQNLIYTVGYDNHGYGPAENVTLVDQLPERATFVSASNGGTYDPGTRSVTWNLGTLDIGGNGQVTVEVALDPVYPAGTTTLSNHAAISTTTAGEQDPSDNEATDTTDVFAAVELAIEKDAAPEPVEAGGSLSYSIEWTVGGNAFAPGVTIVDTLPGLVSFVSASDGGVYNPGTHSVVWTLGEVTPVETGVFTVDVVVDSPVYNGTTMENGVVIADTIGDSASASVVSEIVSNHELQVIKSDSPDPVEAGADLTYTIEWAVTGNEPSPDATVVDQLPDHVTFVSASDGGVYDPTTRTITWNLGELMTPQSGTFTVVVTVDTPLYNGTMLSNTVDFMDADEGTAAVQDMADTTVHADHELHLSKSDSPDPVEKGTELTYTLEWSVTGNEPADNVMLSDPLPFGAKFASASDGGTYDPVTNSVAWNLGTQMTPQEGSVTLVVTINKDFPNGLDILNTATLSDDKEGKEKQADETTAVVQTPEGSIGDTVWYDSNANGIQEPGEPGIPSAGLNLYEAGADEICGSADDLLLRSTITDANGNYRFTEVPAGTYCVDVIDATLSSGLILTGGSDPHGPITLIEGANYRDADFGYSAAVGTGTVGDLVWSDSNGNGMQDAGEVGIGGVTLALIDPGADGACDTADDLIIASTGTAANGRYLFAGVVPGNYCVKVTDTSGVLTDLLLTGGTNPHGPITLASGAAYLDADFGYQGMAAFTGEIGDLVFYDGNRNGIYEPSATERGIPAVTLSLMVAGTDGIFGTADDVVVGTTATDADGHYAFTGIPDGQYQIVVTDQNGRLLGYTQTYGSPDTDNNGQVSPYTVVLTGGASVMTADFAFADGHLLTVSKSNNVPLGQPVEAGEDMIYTISYSASGREAAPNAVLKDVLPMQVDFVSASDGGTYDSVTRLVTWQLGDLNPGDTGTVSLTVHVKKPLTNNSYIFNTVTIVDDAKVTDEATNVIRVHAAPILALTKENAPTGEVVPGDTIAYTLCYDNTGNGNATNVKLSDMVPLYTNYVAGSASGGATYNEADGKLMWEPGTVGPDAHTCVSFQVQVSMTIEGLTGQAGAMSFSEWNALSVDNTAILSSDQLPDVMASVSNILNATVDPAIYKSQSATQLYMGEALTFTVTVTNRGTANATDVVLSDAVHPRFENVNVTSSKGSATYDSATRVWSVAVGTMAPSESVTVVLQGRAATVGSSEAPYQITNTAVVAFAEGASRASNEVVVDIISLPPNEIPEASTWLLLGGGLAGLAGYAERRLRARRRREV